MKHATMLQELLNKCLPEGQQVRRATTIPDSFSKKHGVDEVLLHLPLRLWQLGVHESSHVKGAPPLHGVRDNLQRFLCGLAVSQSAQSAAVTLNTLPTATNGLAFLKETVARGEQCGKVSLPESEPWKGMTWADIMKTHNNEFNPSGAIRSKRGASTSVEELLG